MPYKAYPILNMRQGKRLDLDPWLLPQDAFETLNNCHLKRGVLEKRRGYSLFGQVLAISTTTLDPTLQTNPVMGVFNHLSGSTENLLIADKNRINAFVSSRPANKSLTAVADLGGSPNQVRFSSTGHSFTADQIVTISGTTNYDATYRIEAKSANAFDVEATFVSETLSGATATQEAFEDLTRNKIRFNDTGQTGDWTPAVNDILENSDADASGTVLITLTDYGTVAGQDAFGTIIFKKGTVSGSFAADDVLRNQGTPAQIIGQAIAANSDEAFTGNSTDFFWAENWDHDGASETTYITNNKNPIQIYDGTYLRQLSIDIGTDAMRAGVNNVNSCLLIILLKERIVIFSTNENGTDFFQRARWSGVKDPQSWLTNNFKDAPTSDIMKSADFIGDELYIWFETSVWRFVWTGDLVDPFQWIRVSNTDGTIAQMSLVTKDQNQYAVGANRIQLSDGRDVVAADAKIPDFILDWNQDSLPYSNGVILDEERQIHFTFASASALSDDADQPDDGRVYPDSSLVLNYEDFGFATYSLPIHTFGFSSVESDLTWDDVTAAWEDIDFSWNAGQAKSGFPTTLFGNHLGKVFQMNFGGADNGSDIEFRAVMAQMNPFVTIGHQVKLGYIDFLCDVDPEITFDVKSFVNTDTTEIQTKTVTCDAIDGSDALVWKRVDVFAIANFHRTEITNDASNNRPRIHAMIFWFQDVGGRLV